MTLFHVNHMSQLGSAASFYCIVYFSPFYYIYLSYMLIANPSSASLAMEHNWACHIIIGQYKSIG